MWNPLDPAFLSDPYPTYAALRLSDPVHRTFFGPVVVTRYADVHGLLRNSKLSARESEQRPNPVRVRLDQLRAELGDTKVLRPSILGLDPPEHTRLRGLVQRSFTPRAIGHMRDVVSNLVDELLTDLARGPNEVDLLPTFAFTLPFLVICELLGLPPASEERAQLRSWSRALTATLEPMAPDADLVAAVHARTAISSYLQGQVAYKRENPQQDLLSELITAEEAGERLSEEELITMLVLLFVAGHETTVNLIGNGTVALLRQSDALDRLRSDPSIDDNIADELLRIDSPVQTSGRRTFEACEIAGIEVAADTFVLASLGSANRDPAFWGDTADRIDFDRPTSDRHQSFGNGIHVCLGAHLARLEGELAVAGLLRRFPDLHLAVEPSELSWSPRIILRGLRSLPIRLT